MRAWIDLDGYQFGRNDAMDRTRRRINALISVGELDMGARVTNASATISTDALPFLKNPPVTMKLYQDGELLFTGTVDTIRSRSVIEITARA